MPKLQLIRLIKAGYVFYVNALLNRHSKEAKQTFNKVSFTILSPEGSKVDYFLDLYQAKFWFRWLGNPIAPRRKFKGFKEYNGVKRGIYLTPSEGDGYELSIMNEAMGRQKSARFHLGSDTVLALAQHSVDVLRDYEVTRHKIIFSENSAEVEWEEENA
jgi:hypothetical protein